MSAFWKDFLAKLLLLLMESFLVEQQQEGRVAEADDLGESTGLPSGTGQPRKQ